MVSFTGSTRAGIIVAKTAADTVKRVAQELGGKSANIILPDADFETAVTQGRRRAASATAASPATRRPACWCRPPATTRRWRSPRRPPKRIKVGDPQAEDTDLGPVVSQLQFDKIQRLIETGINEGATLVTGGLGRPEDLNRGYYVRPTVFGHVTPDMTHRARGDLRAGAVDHVLRRRGRGGQDRQRHGLWSRRLRAVAEHRACPRGRRAHARRPVYHQLSGLGHVTRRSAATSSPATAANTPTGRSTTSSRSRASSATGNKFSAGPFLFPATAGERRWG